MFTVMGEKQKTQDIQYTRYISPSLKPLDLLQEQNKELSLQDSSVSGYSAAFMTER